MAGTLTEVPKKRAKPAVPKPEKTPETPFDEPKTTSSYVKPSTEPFPPWPKGDGKGGYTSIEALMEYWNGLPPEFIARTNFYVNRDYPKLDRLQELNAEQRAEVDAKKRRPPSQYIDKPAKAWGEKDIRMAFLRRYGSGDYRVFLNDSGATTREGKNNPETKSRNLCKAKFSAWDTDYPPVLDPSRPDKGLGILDWTFPANQSYIADLRMKGILPPNAKEEDVSSEVVKTLVDKVETLADKVAVHETDRLVERIAERVGPQGNGQSRASELVDVLRATKELYPPPAPPAAALPSSPESQMAGTLQLVQTIMAMKADNPMADIYRMELQSLRDELKSEREETRRLQREMMDKKNGGEEGLETWVDRIEKIAPKIQGILGLGGDKLTDVVHGRRRGFWEELALKAVEELSPGVNSLLTAGGQFLLAPKGGAFQIGPQQQAALPAPNGNGQQPQQQADPLLPLKQKVGNFLGANLKPLQKHFEAYVKAELRDPDDKEAGIQDGSDFAMWIEENHGIEILTDARQLGADQITLMFQSTPAIWAAIKPHEQKFREFLYQVLAYTPDEEGDEGRPVDLTEEK